MADSLEANFALDSDNEQAAGGPSSSSSSRPARSKANGNGTSTSGTKRRAQDDDDDDDSEDLDENIDDAMKLAAGAASAQKKARRKARTKARKARMALAQQELLASSSSSNNPALLPASSQVDFLRKEMRKAPLWRDLSEIEMGERGVREDEVVETIEWKKGRELQDLCDFVRRFATLPPSPGKQEEEEEEGQGTKGAPSVLVLTNNALRAAHIARELRNLLPQGSRKEASSGKPNKAKRQKGEEAKEESTETNGKGEAGESLGATPQQPLQIAKLFSRHFTPAQQVSFLATHRVLAGAGTPQRIALLLSKPRETSPESKKGGAVRKLDGTAEESAQPFALDVSRLTTLVLDAGWKDEKTRSLLDEQGAREGLVEIWEKVRERRGGGQVKVVLF